MYYIDHWIILYLIVPNILSFAETFLVIFFIKYIATFLLERLKRESFFMGSYFGSMNFYQQNSIKNNSKVKFSPWKTYYVRVLVSATKSKQALLIIIVPL